MIKNIIIVILLIIVIVEAAMLFQSKGSTNHTKMSSVQSQNMPPAGPNAKRKGGTPIMISAGMNLKTTPLFNFAHQMAPGPISASAQAALTGWNVSSVKQNDGSLKVSLTPKDSDDQSQQYIVKNGETLYFIEQTPADDKADQDKDLNYRDDYGIIVN